MAAFPLTLFTKWRKRRAIRAYAQRLPLLLRREYGASGTYTPKQICQSIRRDGLSLDYSCYALSMFVDRETFNDFHAAIGETCDYDAMRAEAADLAGRTQVPAERFPAPLDAGFWSAGSHAASGHDGGPGLWRQ
jgi:hypothetical protein